MADIKLPQQTFYALYSNLNACKDVLANVAAGEYISPNMLAAVLEETRELYKVLDEKFIRLAVNRANHTQIVKERGGGCNQP